MALLLVAYQIRMLFKMALIYAGSTETYIVLNGQMTRLNLNAGIARGMCVVVAFC
jgi:hypothetical protein